MSVSFAHLRRIVFGTSCAIVFGFGATQAFAEPNLDRDRPPVCRIDQIRCRCVTGQYFCFPASGGACPDPTFCLVK